MSGKYSYPCSYSRTQRDNDDRWFSYIIYTGRTDSNLLLTTADGATDSLIDNLPVFYLLDGYASTPIARVASHPRLTIFSITTLALHLHPPKTRWYMTSDPAMATLYDN